MSHQLLSVSHMHRVVREMADAGEVESVHDGLALVRLQRHRLHVLVVAVAQRQRPLWDLVQHLHWLRVAGHVGDNDLAHVRLVGQELEGRQEVLPRVVSDANKHLLGIQVVLPHQHGRLRRRLHRGEGLVVQQERRSTRQRGLRLVDRREVDRGRRLRHRTHRDGKQCLRQIRARDGEERRGEAPKSLALAAVAG